MATQSTPGAGRPAGAGTFIERLAEEVGTTATAETVFGHPVERDGITVVPVARARWGFGGGSGKKETGEVGLGGGGGTVVSPVGFIEICDGRSRFRPIVNPILLLATLIAGSALALTLALRLRR